MWWSRALVLLLALSACGFEPVNTGPSSVLRGQVVVDAPKARVDFLLVQRLEERLGRTGAGRYALNHTLRLSKEGLGTDPEGDVRRFNIIGSVDWALRDLNTGEVLASGVAQNFTGYSATGTTVATLAAERDATARLMTILADQIVQRLQAQDLRL